jgi:hypothetical protein
LSPLCVFQRLMREANLWLTLFCPTTMFDVKYTVRQTVVG